MLHYELTSEVHILQIHSESISRNICLQHSYWECFEF